MPNPCKLVAYLRVSTEKQGRSGLGLEAQQAAVTAHVAATGCPARDGAEPDPAAVLDEPNEPPAVGLAGDREVASSRAGF